MIKEKVDKYLKENFTKISNLQKKKELRWIDITKKIEELNGIKNLNPEYVRRRFRYIKDNSISTPLYVAQIKDFTAITGKEDKNSGTKEFTFNADKIPTEEEIIDHFNIDLTKYRISQIWHKTTPGGKYSISVNLQANKIGQLSCEFQEGFKKFCEKQSLKPLKPEVKVNKTETSKFEKNSTVVINLADLHLGKLVSEHETGERYNIDIAKERFLTCIRHLAYKSYSCYGIKKFILSSLGDTLHTDTVKSTTTSGTYVESDTRASKVFEVALEVLTESIDILKQFADEVEFINIAGNHCELSEQHLGIALKAYYRNDSQVTINAEPKVRKALLVGDNLLAWNHGDNNMNTLPLTIATEYPELWGKAKFRLIQLGHLHGTKKKVFQAEDEFNGVIVRHFSSLSGTDSWHNKNNYIGNQKRGTALVFTDNEIGIVGEFYKTI
jgi:hypothetical protein